MSRAMNLTLSEDVVKTWCDKNNVSISAIEILPSGGTHLVCTTGQDAELARQKFSKHVIEGNVPRFPFYRA